MSDVIELLCVEDCLVSATLIKRSFDKYYPDVIMLFDVVDTVSEAIKTFKAGRYTAALIDWNLPDGEGVEVARHIVTVDQKLPIIFLSALFSEENLLSAKEFNPRECLVKDYSSQFTSRIIRHISI